MRGPTVKVRDKQTGHEYFVSEARYRRTPELWERLTNQKPKVTVDEAAARKAGFQRSDNHEAPGDPVGASTEASAQPEGDEAEGTTSGHQADSSKEEI